MKLKPKIISNFDIFTCTGIIYFNKEYMYISVIRFDKLSNKIVNIISFSDFDCIFPKCGARKLMQ